MDKYLKFSSKSEAEAVLFDKIDGNLEPKFGLCVDVIGLIYKETGEVLPSAEGQVSEMEPISGWHVNIRGAGAAHFSEYEVAVATPVRVWA